MVDDAGMIQWLIGQGGIGVLAAFVLFMLNRNYQVALSREREYADTNREDKLALLRVLDANTAALARLTSMIEAIDREFKRAAHD